jgi:DNA-binding response OmpR family regulator
VFPVLIAARNKRGVIEERNLRLLVEWEGIAEYIFRKEITAMDERILVVDDDADILEFVEPFLSDEGYRVRTSPSGLIFQHVQRDLPDLILLDIFLREKDGRVICRQLKANALTGHIPVVLFSAHASREDALRESGADDFISKPFSLQELSAIVRKYLPE